MDANRLGRSLRALRVRRRLRQEDAAALAGISRSQVGRIETGEIERAPVGDVAALCRALGADLDLRARWHGEALDRLLDEAHAGLVEGTVTLLSLAGWTAAVEVSFAIAGERGSVDVLALHEASGTVLVVEVKSVVPDAQAMLAAHDRKTRLGERIASGRGWRPAGVGRLLVIGDSSTSRARVARLGRLFDAAYPMRSHAVRRWLRDPSPPFAGLLFLPYSHGVGPRRALVARERVRRVRRGPPAA